MRISELTVTSFQHRDTYKVAGEAVDSFRSKALVHLGPNALLASTDGLVVSVA